MPEKSETFGEAVFYRKVLEQISQDKRNTRAKSLANSALTFWDEMEKIEKSMTMIHIDTGKPTEKAKTP